MEIKEVAIVIVDISGYTRFLDWNRTSLLHAEQIITELLNSVINKAEYPLTLNKLEGDAALLYTQIDGNAEAIARDVTRQAIGFFEAFKTTQDQLVGTRPCPCDACQNIDMLKLKAFMHYGQAVIKQVRQFEELAGTDVILIHRLLKNELKASEYLMMTEPFHALSGDIPEMAGHKHIEVVSNLGKVPTVVFYPSPPSPPDKATQAETGKGNWFEIAWHRLFKRKRNFHHLP